jgi:hypothetical protein
LARATIAPCAACRGRRADPSGTGARAASSWERYGLKSWIEAARRRLHQNVLAIALANKLARIAWAVLNKERNFVCVKPNLPRPA